MSSASLIVALDYETRDEALEAVDALSSHIKWFKVGKQLFTRYGPEIVRDIASKGVQVFLDLKFHDIPNTVEKASREATRLGVGMFNVHCSGGVAMMEAAARGCEAMAKECNIQKPIVLGVTVLTSISDDVLHEEIRCQASLKEQVQHLALLAKKAGLDGVVASPQEIELIREACGEAFKIVTPGVRPVWASKNDQHRVCTPAEALKKGASYLVVGRPITHASVPAEAATRIIQEIEGT